MKECNLSKEKLKRTSLMIQITPAQKNRLNKRRRKSIERKRINQANQRKRIAIILSVISHNDTHIKIYH